MRGQWLSSFIPVSYLVLHAQGLSLMDESPHKQQDDTLPCKSITVFWWTFL